MTTYMPPALTRLRESEESLVKGRSSLVQAAREHEAIHEPTMLQLRAIHTQWRELSEQLAAESLAPNTSRPWALEFAAARRQAWESLLVAVTTGNAHELSRHQQYWEYSESILAQLHEPSPAEARRILHFWQTLKALTPRVWVTPTLVLVNVVILLVFVLYEWSFWPSVEAMLRWGGNFGPRTLRGEWWRLFTAMFLHYGALHLLFNMWALWELGRLVERFVGSMGFLLLYVLSGLAGSLASVAWNELVVSAGASGAVFGVGGALLGFVLLRRDSVPLTIFTGLRNSMLAFLGYNLVFGLTIPWIDNAAHLGGLVAGFLCGLLLSQPLELQARRRRLWRNLGLAVLGTSCLAMATRALPPPPRDILAELQQISQAEAHLRGVYNTLLDEATARDLEDAELAAQIENQVLVPWRKLREQVAQLGELPSADDEYFQDLLRYFEQREASWQSLIIALREQDEQQLEKHRQQFDAANDLLEQLNRSSSGK